MPSFEFIVEAINEGVMLLDFDGHVLYVNERMSEMLGYTRAQMVGASLFDFMSEEWAHRAHTNLERRAQGVAEVFSHEFRHHDGHALQTLVASRPVRVTNDHFEASLVAITDISERARAVEQLRMSEETFRTVSENSPEGIIIHRQHTIIYTNPAMADLLDYPSAAALEGRALAALVPTEQWSQLEERIAGVEASRQPAITSYEEHALCRADGSLVHVETAHFEGLYHGAPAVISLLRDITQRRELQAKTMQLDRLLVAGTLAAGVGHEVNNPLAFLSGHVDLARSSVDDCLALLRDSDGDDVDPATRRANRRAAIEALEEVRHSLSAAARGAGRIRDVIHNLRVFSHEEHEPPYPLDVHNALEMALRMAAHQIPEYAQLERHYEEVPLVLGYESGLGQILLNILVNAAQSIKEAGPGDHHLSVGLYRADGQVVVEVDDSGVGIDSKQRERIFDPFFTTKEPDIGTGLGLSISKKIVERMGGDIEVDSQPGNGACFRVRLQSAPAEARGPRRS